MLSLINVIFNILYLKPQLNSEITSSVLMYALKSLKKIDFVNIYIMNVRLNSNE